VVEVHYPAEAVLLNIGVDVLPVVHLDAVGLQLQHLLQDLLAAARADLFIEVLEAVGTLDADTALAHIVLECLDNLIPEAHLAR
ncbi:MAG: hypothetical protein ACK56F_13815, partial [bacterium]